MVCHVPRPILQITVDARRQHDLGRTARFPRNSEGSILCNGTAVTWDDDRSGDRGSSLSQAFVSDRVPGSRMCPAIRQHTFQGLADRQKNA